MKKSTEALQTFKLAYHNEKPQSEYLDTMKKVFKNQKVIIIDEKGDFNFLKKILSKNVIIVENESEARNLLSDAQNMKIL